LLATPNDVDVKVVNDGSVPMVGEKEKNWGLLYFILNSFILFMYPFYLKACASTENCFMGCEMHTLGMLLVMTCMPLGIVFLLRPEAHLVPGGKP